MNLRNPLRTSSKKIKETQTQTETETQPQTKKNKKQTNLIRFTPKVMKFKGERKIRRIRRNALSNIGCCRSLNAKCQTLATEAL